MHDTLYGFMGTAFATAPDPDCWAPLPGQQRVFDALVNCLDAGRGIAILTAAAGAGKSLLCQRIAERLRGQFRVAYLPGGGFAGIPALLQAVLFELGRPYQGMGPQELRLRFTSALREFREAGKGTVLILDEAHACSEEALEELRAATNYCQDGRPLLRVLLSGQYALEEMLTSPRLDALNQRIGWHDSLEPLTRSESADFIAYRLRRAGADPARAVSPQALQTICHAAAGNPRCLNRLCDRGFELAAAAGRHPLDDATVRLALEELKRLPLHWNDPPPVDAVADPEQRSAFNEPREHRTRQPVECPPCTGFDEDESGETSVIEFGTGDERPTEIAPTIQPETGSPAIGPEKPAVTAHDDRSTWTPVEPTTSTRSSAPVDSPDVCFAKQPGVVSVRIRPAAGSGRNPLSKPVHSMTEEIVEDHYAKLVAAQQQQPRRVAAHPPVERTVPLESQSPTVELEQPTPDEAIESLLAIVDDAVNDGDVDGWDDTPPAPEHEPAAVPIRFHSIEDYLQSARQDAVRMDQQEPQPAAARVAADARPAEPREVDLYSRLRRLQGIDR